MPTAQVTDATLMPFGKYRGKPLRKVPAKYLLWLFGCTHAGVKQYILDNFKYLK